VDDETAQFACGPGDDDHGVSSIVKNGSIREVGNFR